MKIKVIVPEKLAIEFDDRIIIIEKANHFSSASTSITLTLGELETIVKTLKEEA